MTLEREREAARICEVVLDRPGGSPPSAASGRLVVTKDPVALGRLAGLLNDSSSCGVGILPTQRPTTHAPTHANSEGF